MNRRIRGAIPVKGVILAAICVLLGAAAAPVHAETPPDAQQIADLREIQALDQRVADIGWRLAVSNLALCPHRVAATGIALHTASQYAPDYRSAVQAAFGLEGDAPGVLSVALGSPAWVAGIRPGDQLVAIDGAGFPAADKKAGQASYAATDAAMKRLESIPAGQGPVIALLRGGQPLTVTLAPVAACASRFEMATGGALNANSNGSVVQVFGRLVLALPRDDELALVMAHELAHNVLGHSEAIRAQKLPSGLGALFGSAGRKRREFERVADRYGIYMSARAGFAYADAPRFWRDLAASGGLGAWIAATHPTPANREKNAAAVVAEIDQRRAAGQPLVPSADKFP